MCLQRGSGHIMSTFPYLPERYHGTGSHYLSVETRETDIESNIIDDANDVSTKAMTIAGYLVIDIVDTGAGLIMADQQRLFKEIVQFKPEVLQNGGGSGLGMWISKNIIDLHHGCGYSYDEAEDGMDALYKFNQSLINGGRQYDAILMDFMMPRMDGPTATRVIRQCGYYGPIIGVTGNVLDEDREHFMVAGATRVLIKPVDIESINRAVGFVV
ncbi:unnamed protein product [Sphagnum jensenii]|uniref:histidine kinase n=1 Tax=Sphagnum jensenii TaxID=128206 RepID=A0ABP0V9Q9_9BRYO